MIPIEDRLASFSRIDLTELNRRAALMTRKDTKYLLTSSQVLAFLERAGGHFDVLDIEGKNAFDYNSAYFDSDSLHCFRDHNQNRRKRIKVRYRHYEDTQQFFMEIKLKGAGGETAKLRRPMAPEHFHAHQLPPELDDYLKSVVKAHHQKELPHSYRKTLQVRYRRTTLIAKAGPERVTLDNRLRFAQDHREIALSESLWVVEVKSPKGVSSTDRVLKNLGAKPASLCSKYCVGLSLTSTTARSSRFTPTVKKISALG